ncbi:hypothetical protein UFOVP315_38 [uncultured Caudovirales phage]|uniref:Uncharacterized protein n=1 Tax=uncultured Caudovirales phage TaxID=2100421 RepID=A0A6J5LR68_9CAUD|nr:hypothetical protein UFOVP315_38 [uncultured Caudovirales phage]
MPTQITISSEDLCLNHCPDYIRPMWPQMNFSPYASPALVETAMQAMRDYCKPYDRRLAMFLQSRGVPVEPCNHAPGYHLAEGVAWIETETCLQSGGTIYRWATVAEIAEQARRERLTHARWYVRLWHTIITWAKGVRQACAA